MYKNKQMFTSIASIVYKTAAAREDKYDSDILLISLQVCCPTPAPLIWAWNCVRILID